jgi:MerR family transcriptional regulator, light-induced transcriptional regulator
MNDSTSNRQPRHPIRVVAERTGLSTDVLRAWEKRYGVVEPERSETGQRLYGDADVERLILLRRVTEAGRPISQVAPLATADLKRLVEEDETARTARERTSRKAAVPEAAEYVDAALEAVLGLDAVALDATLVQAALRLGVPVFLEDVAASLLRRIGEGWHRGELRTAHEHMASAVVRRVVSWVLWTGGAAADRGVIVVATPQGQVHELGGLLCAAMAATERWRVVYLGADLPADEIARTAREANASVVALSLIHPLGDMRVMAELRRLRAELPRIAIVAGGGGADSYGAVLREINAKRLPDLDALRAFLQAAG